MKHLTLGDIINQLEACNCECEAGSLRNNTAFIALKEMAYRVELLTLLDRNVCTDKDGKPIMELPKQKAISLQIDGKEFSRVVMREMDKTKNNTSKTTEKEILSQQLELLAERSKRCSDEALSGITREMIGLVHAISRP